MVSKFFDNFRVITILLSIAVTIDCHTPVNNSDVMVTYNGHSEVGSNKHIFYSEQNLSEVKDHNEEIRSGANDHNDEYRSRVRDHNAEVGSRIRSQNEEVKSSKHDIVTTDRITEDSVVFVPNVKPVVRNGDLDDEYVGVNGLMTRKLLKDVIDEKKVIIDTESPNGDVVFISGKNNEHDDKEESAKKESKKEKVAADVVVTRKLNCTNLDCDTNQEPVCGGKVEQRKWRYRMFLNKCFLTKVNCDFRNPINRYKHVDIQKCKDVALKSLERPTPAFRTYGNLPPRPVQNDTRRTSASRRSMTKGADGQFCSHSCPLSCTEEYDPQCAVSGTGRKLVFLNHCKLDLNSCQHRIVWHQRPLSWCVGGKMADVRENRGFIAWMQRAGIVDRKGKLTLH